MTTAIETAPHAASAPAQIPVFRRFWGVADRIGRIPTWAAVLALTLLGGILRFSLLDHPPIWGDEAMTYMRVSGTSQQMLDALQDWGFAPLHYELYWWMRQLTPLTPFMMRLPTAIAGTLMVPVMFWLALQITGGRKVGLVTALFTATSAYLCNYSRDAKMYMDFWFFCALNFACLLWWMNTRTRVARWSWVASGASMLGLNLLGFFVLAIELIALLIWPVRQWRPFIPKGLITKDLFISGVIIMSLGPAGYYLFFNRYTDRIERAGGLHGGGLHWIEPYNRGRDAMDLVLFTTTAHLYSWEWPRPLDEAGNVKDQLEINPRALRWLKIAGITLLSLLALGALPWPRHWTGRETGPVPVSENFKNGDRSSFGIDTENTCESELVVKNGDRSSFSIFPNADRSSFFNLRWHATFLLAAWIVVPGYVFYCASVENFLSPPAAIARIFFQPTDPPPRSPPAIRFTRTPTAATQNRTLANSWDHFIMQFDRSKLRTPQKWWHWTLLIGGISLAIACFIFCGDTMRERWIKLGTLSSIAAALLLICTLIYLCYRRQYSGSVWMPRYLGIVWPALAIVVATLLLRLPTRPLRWAAIAILVGANLTVFGARVFAGSEPPVPLMVRDLLDSQPDGATFRMYYGRMVVPHPGAPGGGTLTSVPGAYYLTILSGRPTTPREMTGAFGGGGFGRFKRWTSSSGSMGRYVANDIRRTPQLERIVVWDKLNPGQIDPADPVADQLGSNWRRSEERLFHARDHWTWRNLYTCRRRVYERIGPPATAPATQSTTASAIR